MATTKEGGSNLFSISDEKDAQMNEVVKPEVDSRQTYGDMTFQRCVMKIKEIYEVNFKLKTHQ